jgi:hypothetical protein
MADPVTQEDEVTNTLAKIALNEEKSGSYFLTDEHLALLSWEGLEELSLALNRNAVEKQLAVKIEATSTGIMISWRPEKNAGNS